MNKRFFIVLAASSALAIFFTAIMAQAYVRNPGSSSGGNGSSTTVFGTNGVTVTALSGGNQTSSLDLTYSPTYTGIPNFSNGFLTSSGTISGPFAVTGAFTQTGGSVALATTTVVGSVTASGDGSFGSVHIGGATFVSSTKYMTVMLDATSSPQTVTLTTSTVVVYTYSVPAGTLNTNGSSLTFKAYGTFTNNTANTGTLSWTASYGAVAFSTFQTTALNSSSNPFGWEISCDLSNGTTTQQQTGMCTQAIKLTGVSNSAGPSTGGPIAVDSTAAKNFTLSLTLAANNATTTATMTNAATYENGATTTLWSLQ